MLQILHQILQLHLVISVRLFVLFTLIIAGRFIILLLSCLRFRLALIALLALLLLVGLLLVALEALTNEQRHGVVISHPLDFCMHVCAVSLELFEDLECWRNVDFIVAVFTNPSFECNTEFLSDHLLRCLWEVSRLLVSKEVEVGLILLELLSDNIKLVSQLVILLGNLKEVISTDGLDDADSSRLELLQELCVVAHEAVSAEARTSVQNIKEQFILLGCFNVLRDSGSHLDIYKARSDKHEMIGDVTVLQNNLTLSVSLALQFADNFIDDVIVQRLQVVEIPDHFLAEDHVLIIIVLQNLLKELFYDVWEILFECFDIRLTKIGTGAVALRLDRSCSLELCEQCDFTENRAFL